jgi:hypothetical protein
MVLLPLSFGCEDDPQTRYCGDQEPTFLLTVRMATGEPLPDDTTVEVTYGGDNSETYSLTGPGESHEVLFCTPEGANSEPEAGHAGQGGASSGGPSTLSCELWIEGGAAVEVNGGNLEPLEMELAPESDECGPVTVEEGVLLGSVEEED